MAQGEAVLGGWPDGVWGSAGEDVQRRQVLRREGLHVRLRTSAEARELGWESLHALLCASCRKERTRREEQVNRQRNEVSKPFIRLWTCAKGRER